MRSIIRVTTNLPDDRLDDFLGSHGWTPRIDSKSVLFETRRKEILDTVHPDDIDIVQATLLSYTLLDDPTKTWGIVNKPNDTSITFRLKNPIPDRLKKATEKLVRDLQSVTEKEKEITFVFEKIEVLEPQGFMHAFTGSILPKNRLALAIERRRTEWAVGAAAFITAIALLILTVPIVKEAIFPPNGEWTSWTIGFLERLSTSAIVTATVSWLNVILYWFELSRQATVIWEA
ncbi:MAG: hypothetical protein AB1476_06505 [Candidatus Hadarchaeota archaeon]